MKKLSNRQILCRFCVTKICSGGTVSAKNFLLQDVIFFAHTHTINVFIIIISSVIAAVVVKRKKNQEPKPCSTINKNHKQKILKNFCGEQRPNSILRPTKPINKKDRPVVVAFYILILSPSICTYWMPSSTLSASPQLNRQSRKYAPTHN